MIQLLGIMIILEGSNKKPLWSSRICGHGSSPGRMTYTRRWSSSLHHWETSVKSQSYITWWARLPDTIYSSRSISDYWQRGEANEARKAYYSVLNFSSVRHGTDVCALHMTCKGRWGIIGYKVLLPMTKHGYMYYHQSIDKDGICTGLPKLANGSLTGCKHFGSLA